MLRRRPQSLVPDQPAAAIALLRALVFALVSALAFASLACGKYGKPQRVDHQADQAPPANAAQDEPGDEEDDERKDRAKR
ncbi:MAG: hypothetical protein QF570_08780 [Myxococcota bacterium]|jgi:hypothetical protein|nr:hypothetical protein [Myxococcota bacterium]